MPCYSPWPGYKRADGTVSINKHRAGDAEPFDLPCGHCIGCKMKRAHDWATRCMHEAQLHAENSFITLTYDDKHLPKNHSLHYPHYQKFMKRLRFRNKHKQIKFYMAGEYGTLNGRPHYHAAIFGHIFPDRKPIRQLTETPFYDSQELNQLWPYGHTSTGDLNYASALYIAKYIIQKQLGTNIKNYTYIDEHGEIHQRTPEFNNMSRGGRHGKGIAHAWYQEFHRDVYPSDEVIISGNKRKPPRYYDKLQKKADPATYNEILEKRAARAHEQRQDNTNERLTVKATVAAAAANQKTRKL